MKKLLIAAGALLFGALVLFLSFPLIIGGALLGSPVQQSTVAQCNSPPASPVSVTVASTQLSASQLHYADIIIGVAKSRNLTVQDAAIGIATAMQESTLSNPTVATDHDSLGLFQQRPSQGWGTPAQVTDPVYATNAFFNALVKIPNRDSMILTAAAQAVQHSGFPYAYQQWAPMAESLAHQGYGQGGGSAPISATLTGCNTTMTSVQATGRIAIVVKAALSQVGVPYVWGGETKGVAFDCSGLMQWSYSQAGIAIPRVANDQYNAFPTKVPITQAALRPGDLLVENWDEQGPGSGWGHVGMYIGGGMVVEAPMPGENVKTISLANFAPVAAARPLPNG